jgi:alpha-N-arabinofuranosidase
VDRPKHRARELRPQRLTDWDRLVVEKLAPFVDYHSVHIYTGSDDHWSNVLAPHQADRALRTVRATIDRARYEGA